MDEDYILALQLQEQFDKELNDVDVDPGPPVPWMPEKPLSVVDPSWETLDPTPDVRAMFLEFNDRFFWGKLSGVEVKWSPRMTLCAGVCCYEGRGGLCSIRLSEPLLKLRPRKDLVETLLHEMIHALLFVTHNDRDHDGHGPNFCKHMDRINRDSGANISVYHNFNEEVDLYRQHWWRCDGPCQQRKPYFGFVKRAMNRAPSAQDPWWEDHRRTCGGTYIKVKEPEGYGKKKEAKKDKKTPAVEKPTGSRDIREVIAFSGKGFVLGGTSSSSTTSTGSASSTVSKPGTHSPPTREFPAVRPPVAQGHKVPAKTSVANASAFIIIDGSPVRMVRSGGVGDDDGGRGVSGGGGDFDGGKGKEPNRLKQASIDTLFKKSTNHSGVNVSPSQTKSPISTLQKNTVTQTPPWKKRPLDDSSSVYEVFSKRLKMETKEDTPTSSHASSSSSSLSSPCLVVMVTCPVCQSSIRESSINQHLDSCLC